MQVIPYAQPLPKEQVRDNTLLVACGVVLVVLGVLGGIVVVGTSMREIVESRVSFYVGVAEILVGSAICGGVIITGVGSIRMRRWSRVIVLAVGANLLIFGTVTLLVMAGLYATAPPIVPMLRQTGGGQLRAAQPPPVVNNGPVVMLWAALMVISLAIVLVFLLVYRSRHVTLALEDADRRGSRLDGRPIQAIGLAMALLVFALLILFAFFHMPEIPDAVPNLGDAVEARVILAGVMIALGVCFAWAGLLILRLHPLGPWLALLLIGLTAGGMVAAMTNEELRDSFDPPGSNYSPMELNWYLRMAFVRGVFVIAAYAIPMTIYVLRVRRIFFEMNTTQRALT